MAARLHRKTKLDPYLDQLGIIPDAELAAMAGVTAENVRAYRTRRGIPARWRGEGGAVPGDAVATMGKGAVKHKRAAAAHLSGAGSDDTPVSGSLSVDGGASPVGVGDGIVEPPVSAAAPQRSVTLASASTKKARSRKTRLGAFLDKLGVLPDAEIAALAGVTAENVRTYRKRRGIPAGWRGETAKEAFRKGADGRRGKLAAYQEQIGILPDARIAELAGTSPANVRAWRLRHGVPARWRGEGDPLPNEEAIRLLDAGRAVPEPSIPARAVAPAPAPPLPTSTVSLPDGGLDGYEVTVESGDTWLVVASDIAEAARKAMDVFAERGIEGRVINMRFVARLLEG